MAEEQRLLRELQFLSNLINKHKNQDSQMKTVPHQFRSTAPNGRTFANINVKATPTPTLFNAPSKRNVTYSKVNTLYSTINPGLSSKRIVVPTVVKKCANESSRVVLRSSTPKGKNLTSSSYSSVSISPITTTSTATQNANTRTVLTTKVASSVNAEEKQTKSRIVLQPSRYKWTSQPKSSSTTTETAKLPDQIINSNLQTLRVPALSPLKKEKLNKSLVTKYKVIRSRSNANARDFRGVYKLVNSKTPRKSPKFVRKVGKYSIKYVAKDGRTVKKKFRNGNYYTNSFLRMVKKNSFFSPSPANKKRKAYKIDKTGKCRSISSKFTEIGGILYKKSFNKLSRTDKKMKSDLDRPIIAKLNSNVSKTITVSGVKYALDSYGKTLRRVTKTSNSSNRSRIDLGGETFIQTKPGVFVKSQATKTRNLANRSVNRSINRLVAAKKKSSQFCLFFNRFGKCSKKELGTCPYIHDPEKIAVCTRFLQGNCTVENCPFSHTVCTNKMPVCTFFIRGRCNVDSCPYRHVNVNPQADVCSNFVKGFCALGDKCKKLHVFSCPEFEKDGKCSKGQKCPLKHVVKKKKERYVNEEKQEIEASRKYGTFPSHEIILKILSRDKIKLSIASSTLQLKKPSSEDDWTNTSRLPSFIKLDDDNESNENGSTCLTPLRIRPQFLN